MRHRGVMYSRASTHTGNSLVMFYRNGDTTSPTIPASIQKITNKNGVVNVVVRRFAPTADLDPFAAYPHFPAQLYSKSLLPKEKIPLSWILCHFAKYRWSEDHVVVLSLCRVSQIQFIKITSHTSLTELRPLFYIYIRFNANIPPFCE